MLVFCKPGALSSPPYFLPYVCVFLQIITIYRSKRTVNESAASDVTWQEVKTPEQSPANNAISVRWLGIICSWSTGSWRITRTTRGVVCFFTCVKISSLRIFQWSLILMLLSYRWLSTTNSSLSGADRDHITKTRMVEFYDHVVNSVRRYMCENCVYERNCRWYCVHEKVLHADLIFTSFFEKKSSGRLTFIPQETFHKSRQPQTSLYVHWFI